MKASFVNLRATMRALTGHRRAAFLGLAGLLIGCAALVVAAGPSALATAMPTDPVPGSGTTITGTVFEDFNSDGSLSEARPGLGAYGGPAVDRGIGGVTVTVFNAAGAVAGTATTDPAGHYTITGLTQGTPYRVEFAALPGYEQSARGSNPFSITNGTSVQFASGGSRNVSFALFNPCKFCQDDPSVSLPTYINGPYTNTSVFSSDVLVRFKYSSGDVYPYGSNTPGPQGVGLGGQVGATWGLVYHPTSRKLFSSAFTKRYAAFGPGGPGAIYVMDPFAPTPNGRVFLDVTTLLGPNAAGVDPHPVGAPNPYLDAATYDKVGEMGLGDLAISENGETLYTVNLFSRTLLMINIGNPPTVPLTLTAPGVVPGPREMGSFEIPKPCANPDDARPFALGQWQNKIYVGGVCSGKSGQVGRDVPITDSVNFGSELSLYVYRFDPGTGLFSPTPVLQQLLNYPRRCAIDADNDGVCEFDATWRPWRDQFPVFIWNTDPTTTAVGIRNATPVFLGEVAYPQPWLTDIEFTLDGDMLLGLRDRFPDQQGFSSPEPIQINAPITYYLYAGAQSTQLPRIVVGLDREVLYSADGAGDLLRACLGPSGWTFENAGSCGGRVTLGAGNQEGPGGGSYFFRDGYQPDAVNPLHDEVALGGLAIAPGFPDLIASVYNPYQPWSSGVRWFSDQEGTETRAYQVFASSPNTVDPVGQTFGKGNGLGDLTLMCDSPPIEIGNRVWLDMNKNGLQDADEAPIPGVTVRLYDIKGRLVATTTTDAAGTYYFNSAGPDRIPFTLDDIATAGPDKTPNTEDDLNIPGLKPSTLGVTNAYTVALDNPSDFAPGGPLAGLYPTVPLTGSASGLARMRPSLGAGGVVTAPVLIDSNGLWLKLDLVSSPIVTLGLPGQNDHSIDFGFNPTPPLTITKSVEDDYPSGAPPAVQSGSRITYTLRITNTGQLEVPAVLVTDSIPIGVAYVLSSAVPAPLIEGDPLVWSVGAMAPGAVFVASFAVIVQPTSADVITNSGFVNGLESNQVINVKQPTAIALVSFSAARESGGVVARWQTSAEQNTLGFRLYRAATPDRLSAVAVTPGLIAASGSVSGGAYAWQDSGAPAAGALYYWLQEIDTAGAVAEYGPALVGATPGFSAFLPYIAR